MKKSFLYVLSAALLLTLSLSGCPQDADDDDDPPPPPPAAVVTPPSSDLSYIAYAFGQEDISTVKVINDISLEKNELVIPAGKTLDLGAFKLGGITDNSKIIIWKDGNINFGASQGGALRLTDHPGAKIIADSDFINANVYVDYTYNPASGVKYTEADWIAANIPPEDRPGIPPENKDSAKYWANWNQVVVIDTFDAFKTYAPLPEVAPTPDTAARGTRGYLYGDKYVAVFAPDGGNIGSIEADEINEKADGLCFYLVGLPVTFNSSEIDIDTYINNSYYKKWEPAPIQQAPSSVFNYDTGDDDYDPEGSLVVAGNVNFFSGSVKAKALTVWGVIEYRAPVGGAGAGITSQNTSLTAWTVRAAGASFGGDVNLLGSAIENTFGEAAIFGGKTKITGPASFAGATFDDDVVFSGPVVFSGDKNGRILITFKGNTTFADNAYIHGNASFDNTKDNRYYKELGGLSVTEIIAANLKSGDPTASLVVDETTIDSGMTFNLRVAFKNPVTVSEAGDYTFNDGVTFQETLTISDPEANFKITGNAEFQGAVTGAGSITTINTTSTTSEATFENALSIAYGEFAGPVTVTGDANIDYGVFKGATTISGNGTITAGTFSSAATITGAPTIEYGKFSGVTEIAGATITYGEFSGATTITGDANITAGTFSSTATITGNPTIEYGSFSGATTISGEAAITTGSFSAAFDATGRATFSDDNGSGSGYFGGKVTGSVTFSGTSSAYFAGDVDLANAEFGKGTVIFPDNSSINIDNVTFGTYASLQNVSQVNFENATFADGGSLGVQGGNINEATFNVPSDATEAAQFISSGPLYLSNSGIILPTTGTIAVPNGGVVNLDANGISITGHGSIGPTIVFSGDAKVLTLLGETPALTLIAGDEPTYYDFINGAANSNFITNGIGSLTTTGGGSFTTTEGNTFTVTADGGINFLTDDIYGGSLTLDKTVLDLSGGGSVTLAGTANMLILTGGGNLITSTAVDVSTYGSALNGEDVGTLGVIITTFNEAGAGTVLVGGSLDVDSTLAGSVGTLNTNIITSLSRFSGTLSGTSATAGSETAVTGPVEVVGSIAVFKQITTE
jgi:hypothetical protein